MKEDANELVRKGRFRESIGIAVDAMGKDWRRRRASPSGHVTIQDTIEFLQILLKKVDVMRASQDPGAWSLVLDGTVIEELIAKIAIVEAENLDWIDGPADARTLMEEDVERYQAATRDVGKVLKALEAKDTRIEDVLPLIMASEHRDTVEELLVACGPAQPTLIGPTGPLLDLNVKRIPKFLTSRHSHPIMFEVDDANETSRIATVRIHADTSKDVRDMLHGTREPLQMDLSACNLGWEHCYLAQGAKILLRGTSSMNCAVLRIDRAKTTLRLTSVRFSQGLTLQDIKARIDQRLLVKIEPALSQIGAAIASEQSSAADVNGIRGI